MRIDGSFQHPIDMTPIGVLITEEIRSTQHPVKEFYHVSERTEISYRHLVDPRCVIVANLAGADEEAYPTDSQALELAKCELLVGPPGAEELCLVKPRVLGMHQGGSQIFLLSPGQRLFLTPKVPGCTIPVRVQILPGSEA
jgi:hypothetical protein